MQGVLKELNNLIENVGGFENTVFLLVSVGLALLIYFLLRHISKNQEKVETILKDSEECKNDREALRLELQQTKIRNEQLDKYNKEARQELSQSKNSLDTVVNTFNDTIKMLIDKV